MLDVMDAELGPVDEALVLEHERLLGCDRPRAN
jgi:hypothetical protein